MKILPFNFLLSVEHVTYSQQQMNQGDIRYKSSLVLQIIPPFSSLLPCRDLFIGIVNVRLDPEILESTEHPHHQ